jgi:putative transposase
VDHLHLLVKGATEVIDFGIDGRPERTYPRLGCLLSSRRYARSPIGAIIFWAKGYCVDTVGLNGEMIQKYVRYQEKEE